MEGQYRIIHTRFWNDNFISELDPLDRYVFLYFLTNEHANIAGIYELPMKTMEFETGLKEDIITIILTRLEKKISYYEGWIIIKNFLRYQNTKSPTVKKGISYILNKIPKNVIEYAYGIDRVWIQYGYSMDTVVYSKVNRNRNRNRKNIKKKNMDDITIEPDESLIPTGKWKKQEAKKKGYVGDEVIPLVKWAEEKMGRKYPSQIPQRTAVSQMLNSGYSSQEIKDKFEELEEDDFWSKKGVDFKTVLSQIAKVKQNKKLNPMLYAKR